MESTASTPHIKPVFLQDLWSELSAAFLFFSEIIWASVIFCTLFNQPLAYFKIGLWLTVLGFFIYFGSRISAFLLQERWMLITANTIMILTELILFIRFVIYKDSILSIWHMIFDPFMNLSQQPVLQSQLWQMLFLVLLLKRGLTLAGSTSNYWRPVLSFQMGMLLFFFFGFTTTWDNFLINLTPFLLYLLFIIIALTSSRLALLSNQPNYRFPGFSKSWFLWIVALTILLISFGIGIGWLTGVGFVTLTDWLLKMAYGLGISLVVLLFSPLIALIGLLLPWLDKLLASITGHNLGLDQLKFIQSLNNPDPVKAAAVNNFINQFVTIILIAAILITTVLVIVGIRRRILRNRIETNRDLHSKIYIPAIKRSRGVDPENLRALLDQAKRWLVAARIRRIYQQLMDSCKKLDTPRPAAFTPHEFLPELIALFPGKDPQLSLLTEVYQRVRYGELPETQDEMDQIVEAWKELKAEADIRIKDRRKRLKMK